MIEEAIRRLSAGNDLTAFQMETVMEEIMTGKAGTERIISFLTSLDKKGESAQELSAAVQVMRRHATRIKTSHKVVLDTCGTGGDRKHTFNISTAAAFVTSGAGIAVAKHGNRSVSSKSGSADVMEALGVNINLNKERTEKCLDEIGIAFLFAQNFHPAMKYASEARKKIGAKTIFNFLGPLSNPAGASHQLVGVYDGAWAPKLALVLKELNANHALVVHGEDNLDEISTVDKTLIFEVRGGKVEEYKISYADFGLEKAEPQDLTGGDAVFNANLIVEILKGAPGPKRDIVLLNAGAAVFAADAAKSIKEGIEMAADSIDSGKALQKLQLLRQYSKGD